MSDINTAKTNGLTIVIVDDDRDIRELLMQILLAEGYNPLCADGGEEMFAHLSNTKVDLILLDVMLSGRDGFELCRQLRTDPAMPPIIMITAKDDEIDQVVGLELGADDYIVKPFRKRELLARIKAVIRRATSTPFFTARSMSGAFHFSGWEFHPTRMELIDSEDVVIPLSQSENDLLLAFVQYPQIPLSRDRLLDLTKGRQSSPFDRSIDTHVSRLRRKLRDDAKKPDIIKTAWGAGYVFTKRIETR